MLNMPALSPTMTQGNLSAWLKSVGDAFAAGDPIAEIETDKASMEFEAPDDGYLAAILVPAGAKDVPVGDPMAVMVAEKEDVEKFKDYRLEGADKASSKTVVSEEIKSADGSKPSSAVEPKDERQHATDTKSASTRPSSRIIASPLAKSVAKDRGIDLSDVTGSGPGNRIVKKDLDQLAGEASKSRPMVQKQIDSSLADARYTDVPLSAMRKIIAARLQASKQEIPHYYIKARINMDRITEIRQRLNVLADGKYKLSINDFVIKAAAKALKKVQAVNSAWHGDFIRQYDNADISVAVATDAGLITPIVANADAKGLLEISAEVRELAARARLNKLAPQEYQGGTFTISNLGMFGVDSFTAIINPPQSCILAVGATKQHAVPSDDGTVRTASMMSVILSCDHRVVDGATGAQWLQSFKCCLEDPISMLL